MTALFPLSTLLWASRVASFSLYQRASRVRDLEILDAALSVRNQIVQPWQK